MRNPILPIADPFVTYFEGSYYITGTGTGTSVRIWASARLTSIGDAAGALVWAPQEGQPLRDIWSPSMFLLPYKGAEYWFIYVTASIDDTYEGHRLYVLQSQGRDPLGPYTFKGRVAGVEDATAIDPSLLRVHGALYLLYVKADGANITYIARLSDPLTQGGAETPLIYPDQPWERGMNAAEGGVALPDESAVPHHTQPTYPVAEGPTALYYEGRTFIAYSGSHTGNKTYCVGLLVYDGQGDPLRQESWTKKGPVFRYSAANGVYGPGRATFTTSPDATEHWMVYHAKASAAFTVDGRTARAQRFMWNEDGTPDFGVPMSLETDVVPPSGEMGTG